MGGAYLKESFFHQIGAQMPDQILLVLAEKDGKLGHDLEIR